MSEGEHAAQPVVFKDRTVGLIVFGCVEVLMGGLCALMVPLMLVGMMFQPPGGPSMDLRMMLPGMIFYCMVAVFFIWVGIGSILTRRWARAVMLVCSWLWLICGVLGMAVTIWMLPNMFDQMPPGQQMPQEMVLVMQIMTGGFAGCFYVILPLAFVLFYRSEDVWATCQAADPRVRWTDRCPLPVLALVIMFAFGVFSLVWMPTYNFAVPWFGDFLDGAAGAAVVLGVAAVEVYLVWGLYHRRVAAWWTAVLFVVVASVSGSLTVAQTDLMELYERMGLPPEQLDIIKQMGMIEQMNSAWWLGIPAAVAFLGYLVYAKRYFGDSEEEGNRQ